MDRRLLTAWMLNRIHNFRIEIIDHFLILSHNAKALQAAANLGHLLCAITCQVKIYFANSFFSARDPGVKIVIRQLGYMPPEEKASSIPKFIQLCPVWACLRKGNGIQIF
jgi:hypothetical protein